MLSSGISRTKLAKFSTFALLSTLISVVLPTAPAKAITDLTVASIYLDAPMSQGSYARYYSGVTENFDGLTQYCTASNHTQTLAVGSASGTFGVCQENTYGASTTDETATVNGARSRILFVPTNQSVTITFSTAQKYVGFWWSGGDAYNSIKFFSGGSLVATMTTADVKAKVGASAPSDFANETTTISATDGSTYLRKYYWGNPNGFTATNSTTASTIVPNEPFAYVHAFAQNGQDFDSIQLTQGASGGFEIDNLTVSTQNVPIRDSLAYVSDVQSNCTQSSNNDGNGVTTVRFTGTSLCSFNAPAGVTTVSVIAVGGGGGGGGVCVGGGGGGGGFYRNREVTINGLMRIRLGAGGAGGGGSGCGGNRGATGESTTVTMTGFSATAIGGGGGGSNTGNWTGLNGASGGGGAGTSSGTYAGGTGVSGQGNSGGTGVSGGANGGGGGGGYSGAGSNGSSTNGGNGGAGLSITIFGGTQNLSGGGGGASDSGAGTGGQSCGGNGAGVSAAAAATAATGYGCGGGGGDGSYAATAGSSGVVFISYLRPTDIKWDIQSKKTATAGSCGYGDFTQTVIGDPTGNFTIARFETKVETDNDPNGDGNSHQITDANCTFIVPKGVTKLTYLLVGGGGGGGYDGGGGGGGGQIREDSSFAVTEGDTISVHVGAGGKGGGWWQSGSEAVTYVSTSCAANEDGASVGHNGQSGADTYIQKRSDLTTITAAGGGGGGGRCQKGLTTSRNSTSANAGGNGHRYYVNASDSNSTCKLTDSCTYGGVDAVGAGLSQGGKGNSHQGGGGGGAGGSGGNATYRYRSYASGGNGSARFTNNPIIAGTYGGGGGGGTYCKYSTDPYGGTTYCNGINWLDFGAALGGNSGGDGGNGLGNATSSGSKSTGGGGGGAGGYGTIKGGYGSGGIAFLMWKVPLAVSGTSISVKRTIVSGTDTITAGTMSLLQAPLYDTGSVSCGTFTQKTSFTMVNDSATVWNVYDSVTVTRSQLTRGYCYTWSEDPNFGTSSTASNPTTNTSNLFGNLTSPILMLPYRPDVKIPKVVPVDPRLQTVNLGSVKVSQGSGKVQACFYENNGSTITGNQGVPANSQNLLFSSSVAIDTQTSGNTRDEFRWVYSTVANNALKNVLSKLSMTRYNTTRFSVDRYVLIRLAPYLNNDFVTDCVGTLTGNTTSYTSDLYPTDSDVYIVRLRPITLVNRRTAVVKVKK